MFYDIFLIFFLQRYINLYTVPHDNTTPYRKYILRLMSESKPRPWWLWSYFGVQMNQEKLLSRL